MPNYIYDRELVDGCYNVDNPLRVDGEGNQIHLATEVDTAIPGKTFKMRCFETVVTFLYDQSLTAGQQTTLANTVQAHKDNT